MSLASGQEIPLNNPASPLFQQGERVLKGGSATRYLYKPTGWTTSTGTLWLTNQRIIFSPGFAHQQNWPLDHISEVRIGTLDSQELLQFLFSNGMREHFAIEGQDQWIAAVGKARSGLKSTTASAKKQHSVESDDRHYRRFVAVIAAWLFISAGCIFIVAVYLMMSR